MDSRSQICGFRGKSKPVCRNSHAFVRDDAILVSPAGRNLHVAPQKTSPARELWGHAGGVRRHVPYWDRWRSGEWLAEGWERNGAFRLCPGMRGEGGSCLWRLWGAWFRRYSTHIDGDDSSRKVATLGSMFTLNRCLTPN